MNINVSSIFSLLGLFITIISILRFKEQFEKYKILSATIIILYALGLFFWGQYVINDSRKFHENLITHADIFPPNSGCLAIYYLTSFLAFMFGLILLVDDFDKGYKKTNY